jgi:hypothetical protein
MVRIWRIGKLNCCIFKFIVKTNNLLLRHILQ